jgi:hypothetical protein
LPSTIIAQITYIDAARIIGCCCGSLRFWLLLWWLLVVLHKNGSSFQRGFVEFSNGTSSISGILICDNGTSFGSFCATVLQNRRLKDMTEMTRGIWINQWISVPMISINHSAINEQLTESTFPAPLMWSFRACHRVSYFRFPTNTVQDASLLSDFRRLPPRLRSGDTEDRFGMFFRNDSSCHGYEKTHSTQQMSRKKESWSRTDGHCDASPWIRLHQVQDGRRIIRDYEYRYYCYSLSRPIELIAWQCGTPKLHLLKGSILSHKDSRSFDP